MKDKAMIFIFILMLFFVAIVIGHYKSKLEHEKTIQKAIECGYQPLCIGGDYWNKGD